MIVCIMFCLQRTAFPHYLIFVTLAFHTTCNITTTQELIWQGWINWPSISQISMNGSGLLVWLLCLTGQNIVPVRVDRGQGNNITFRMRLCSQQTWIPCLYLICVQYHVYNIEVRNLSEINTKPRNSHIGSLSFHICVTLFGEGPAPSPRRCLPKWDKYVN